MFLRFKNFSKTKEAFTLIEVLIVIAMIGILSTIAMFSLSPSRNKAKDTKIIAYLNELRSISTSYYDPLKGKYNLESFLSDPHVRDIYNNINSMGIESCLLAVKEDGSQLIRISICTRDGIPNFEVNVIKFPNYILFYSKLLSGGGYCVDTLGNSSSTSKFDRFINQCK